MRGAWACGRLPLPCDRWVVPGGAEIQRKRKRRRGAKSRRRGRLPLIAAEVTGLLTGAFLFVVAALGHAAGHFIGDDLWSGLLPFAAAVLVLALVTAVVLGAWLTLRRWLIRRMPFAPAVSALVLAGVACWGALQAGFATEVSSLRLLLGGRAAAERRMIAHQVLAAYRRADHAELSRMLDRARAYDGLVREAARAYQVDPEVLIGIAAAESSFAPRDGADGGRGLFQITSPPTHAMSTVQAQLGVTHVDLHDPRHNALVAAATLRCYLDDMHGDLFLALLAYNIGPHNGGLRAIMEQYGARDFVTIQPYLQHLPRDYPIRVLAAALAYRVRHIEGRLPPYEEGDNAVRIQRIGIPGLQSDLAADR